ncbi:hypothetical protein GPALN_014890 [Globodera pallida]|nr:hypothetical protein GPALN_014890 [Globodera pallida]
MNRYGVICLLLLAEVVVVPIVTGSPAVIRQKRTVTGKELAKGAAIGAAAGVAATMAAAGIKKSIGSSCREKSGQRNGKNGSGKALKMDADHIKNQCLCAFVSKKVNRYSEYIFSSIFQNLKINVFNGQNSNGKIYHSLNNK